MKMVRSQNKGLVASRMATLLAIGLAFSLKAHAGVATMPWDAGLKSMALDLAGPVGLDHRRSRRRDGGELCSDPSRADRLRPESADHRSWRHDGRLRSWRADGTGYRRGRRLRGEKRTQ